MDIEMYYQYFLSSIKLRELSFPEDYISSSTHPRNFTISQGSDFANGPNSEFFFFFFFFFFFNFFFFFFFFFFSNFSVFDIEKTLGRRQRSLRTMFFHTFVIRDLKWVYYIKKLLITYQEAWKLPLRFQ